MINVTLYTKPNCPQCDQTKNFLKMKGMSEEQIRIVDLTQSPEDLNMVKSKGFVRAPVVQAGDKWWSGFNRALIESLFGENQTKQEGSGYAIEGIGAA